MQNYHNNNSFRQHSNRMQFTPAICCDQDDCLAGLPLAMAYVPWQNWQNLYELCQGYNQGTIFKELDKPFMCRGGQKR